MVTSVQSLHSPKILRTEGSVSHMLPQAQNDPNDTRQRLALALQMSLDIDDLLRTFFHHSRELIHYTGLEYHHELHHIAKQQGKNAVHSSNYRLQTADGNLGELTFSGSKRFRESDLAQIESLIGTLIYPLRNALLYHEALQTALTDPLTGTGNRVALDNAMHRELQLVERFGQDVSLLVIDIDHFKQVNDTYGHSVGDQVLKEIASTIKSISRTTDMTFRYGGEEFVVILSKTAANGAAIIAERIRQFVERLSVPCLKDENSINVRATISIGISTLHKGQSLTDFFDRADHALYQAKDQGRNRVVCASEMEPSTTID